MDARTALSLLAAALLLAGCQAPGATSAAGPGADAGTTVEVRNATGATVGTTIPLSGNASVDPGAVLDDLQAMLGTDAPAPGAVRVVDDIGANLTRQRPRIWRLLDVVDRAPNRSLAGTENGATSVLGTVTVYPGANRTERSTRWVVAHELVHYVHLYGDRWAQTRNASGLSTTDGRFVYRATVEGPAVWSTDRYLERHAAHLPPTEPFYDELIGTFPPGSRARYTLGAYAAGNDYVEARVDDPRNLSVVFEEPARTAEQVLHGLEPGVEPPAALSVRAADSPAWVVGGRDRMGEMFLRVALQDGIGVDRAARAAAGWGNDSLAAYYPDGGGEPAYAWVLRFDDAANASAFDAAARDYLDAKAESATEGGGVAGSGASGAAGNAGSSAGSASAGDPAGAEIRRLPEAAAAVRTVDERTRALLLGPERFVAGTEVAARGGDVVAVRPPS